MAERTFPLIDFKALTEGQVLDVEYLEKLFGVPRTTTRYTNNLRTLMGEIKRHARLPCCSIKQAVYMMEPKAASEYYQRRLATLAGSFVRTVTESAVLVDPSRLEEGDRRRFESHSRHATAMALEAAKFAARRQLPSGD